MARSTGVFATRLAPGLRALPDQLWMRWGRGGGRALGLVVSRAHITVSNEGWWFPGAMDGRPMWVEGAEMGFALSGLWPVAGGHLESKQKSHSNLSACREPSFSSTGAWGATVASSCALDASQSPRFLHQRLLWVRRYSLRRRKGGWERPLH